MASATQGGLVRSLGLFSVFVLTVSSIIGTGIYKKITPMAMELGSPALILICWAAAGIITLFGTLSNAEVASMLADSGGEYVYFRKIYNKFFAFLFGWSSFTAIRSASIASIAYVFSQSLNLLVPLPGLPERWADFSVLGIFTPFENFGVKIVTILLIVSLSYVNYRGLKLGESLSKTITYLVIASIFLIIILGLTIGGGSFENIHTTAAAYVSKSWLDSSLWQSFFAALLAAFWAYEGWSAIGFLGGEIKNAKRNLPLALVTGVLFVMMVYLAINFTYLYILPVDTIIGNATSSNNIAAVGVVGHFLGTTGIMFMSVLILFTTFGCTNTTLLPPPRLYYAMAKEGMFFKGAAYIHPVYNTPSKSILYQAIWASILVLSGSFDQLTDMLIFAAFIFYGATALGVFILRLKMPDAPRPYKAWGYPVIPALFILFCVALVIVTLISKPREALMGLTLMFSGVPFYFYWNRKAKE
ncbi:MAG: amino acid permease [Cyclobacteriaceae bacterium]|nr:amino acid permease [Cyclobacteriaceae bacterium]